MKMLTRSLCLSLTGLALLFAANVQAAEKLELGDYTLEAPEKWESKKPKFTGIVKYEFAVPAEGDDKEDGRVTIGPLGGGAEANVQRWLRSFKTAEGDEPKTTKKEVAGTQVVILDVTGTYTAPPFSGGGTFEKYRQLVGMVLSEGGAYYVKFIGPQETVTKHEKAFTQMMEGLKKN